MKKHEKEVRRLLAEMPPESLERMARILELLAKGALSKP